MWIQRKSYKNLEHFVNRGDNFLTIYPNEMPPKGEKNSYKLWIMWFTC